jgi:maleylacetate reductase
MREFTYEALPMRVVFGPVSGLGAEVEALGLKRVLAVCGPRHASAVGALAGSVSGSVFASVFTEARMHVPVELVDRAAALAESLSADGLVAFGGGSAIGLGKAIALRHELPIIAVPTTYAGSEMTPVWGQTENGVKRTGRDRRVLPRSVLYDATLTVSMPARLSLTSGINAIAHAVEALYAPDLTPLIALQAEEAIRALAGALPRVLADGTDLEARSDAQYGAWLCGSCLAACTMGLHHKLCHTLGGTLDLPHAETHTTMLPYVLAFNSAPAAVRRALGTEDPAGALWELGGRSSLRDLGMRLDDIDRIADLVLASTYANPRRAGRGDLVELLKAAWAGARP